ncbi:MAG: hypothetical protein ACK53D_04985 [Pseudanabaena sp.]
MSLQNKLTQASYSDRKATATPDVPAYSYSIADLANAMRWHW